MVHIHLISLNQGGVTEALTVFIVILFLPVQKAGGSGGRGGFNTSSFVQCRNEFCQLSLSPGYWWKLAAAKYSLSVIDVTAGVVPLKGTKEFRAMWINRERVGEILCVWGGLEEGLKGRNEWLHRYDTMKLRQYGVSETNKTSQSMTGNTRKSAGICLCKRREESVCMWAGEILLFASEAQSQMIKIPLGGFFKRDRWADRPVFGMQSNWKD